MITLLYNGYLIRQIDLIRTHYSSLETPSQVLNMPYICEKWQFPQQFKSVMNEFPLFSQTETSISLIGENNANNLLARTANKTEKIKYEY